MYLPIQYLVALRANPEGQVQKTSPFNTAHDARPLPPSHVAFWAPVHSFSAETIFNGHFLIRRLHQQCAGS